MIFTDIIPVKKINILICLLILPSIWIVAQNVGVNTIMPQTTFHVELGNSTTNGVLFSGTLNNETNFPSYGAGNRFMFYPARAALRAGTVGGTHWDNAKVGIASVAFGSNTIARSAATFATNYVNTAGGFASSAFGSYNITKGYSSMVIGMYNDSLIVGSDEFAPSTNTPLFLVGNGNSEATRHNTLVVYKKGTIISKNPEAFYYTKLPAVYPLPVSGEGTRLMWLPEISAFRVGTAIDSAWDASKIGNASFATGINSTASGSISLATGLDSKASGELSTAMGHASIARGYSSTAIGMFNNPILTVDETENATPETPLFMVGNGDDYQTRHNAIVVYKNGNFLLKHPSPLSLDPGVLAAPIDGPGTRMIWMPGKSAFRAGTALGSTWDTDNIGTWSFASGLSTKASGLVSTAFGINALASGEGSTAFGGGSLASGGYSMACGWYSRANGSYSSASGIISHANGYGSTVSGWYNIAKGFASTVIGVYNDTLLATNQINYSFDTPLFVIGNGDSPESLRSNAMVVYKNGIVSSKNRLIVSADPGAIPLPASITGAGTRMMWIPEKSAFRVGTVNSTQWDGDKIGAWSFASGWNVTAKGIKSTVMGSNNSASGEISTAMGHTTESSGKYSLSAGFATISNSYLQTTFGRYNDTLAITNPNATAWEDDDALFVVGYGSGTGFIPRANAFIIYKSGDIDIRRDLAIDGFTRLGDSTSTSNVPNIKMKKLTGSSHVNQNAFVNVPHGLTKSKILSAEVILAVPGWVNLPPCYTYNPGYEYQVQISDANIVVINTNGNSGNILNKTFTVLITYEE